MSSVNGVNENDWKQLRRKLPDWQENYMDKLIHEYVDLLQGEGNPSDRFWALEKRIREDKKDTGVSTEMSRSRMLWILHDLFREGAITLDDLDGFSDELKEGMASYAQMLENWND